MNENIQNPYEQYMYSYPHKTAYENIDKLELKEYQNYLNMQETSMYFHIPFCETKCGYCNLFSVAGKKTEFIDKYIDTVKKHSKQMREKLNFDSTKFESLVFGGGTPLILSEEQLETLFNIAEKDFNIDLDKIYTVIETSPNQTTYDKLKYLKTKKVNRISIGVQSFIEEELKILRRFHSVEQTERAIEDIKKLNFESFNIDLIYGIKGQTLESLSYSIKKAINYKPDELFIYPLYQKENTGIFNKFEIDRELQYKMYFTIKKILLEAGYFQTSMRRFVREKPKKNLSCGFENMISLGCGGRTYIGPLHFCETYTSKACKVNELIKNYINKTDFFSNLSFYKLNQKELKRRFLIKNLMQKSGISVKEYQKIFKTNLYDEFTVIEEFISKKYLFEIDEKLKLTSLGLSLSDYIGPKLISKEVKEKMKKYRDE